MLLESLKQMSLRWLRIPPGTSLRKNENKSSEIDYANNDYINVMVDITVDDICIGEEPVSVSYKSSTPQKASEALESIKDEFNTIVKWVAKDLCINGYSVYSTAVEDKKRIVLLPFLEDVEFYMTKSKKIVAYKSGDDENLTDVLIFINYSKVSLEKIEDSSKQDLAFKINPEPMQLKNVKPTIAAMSLSEQSLLRYRTQLSRIARWINVDIGVSQGDTQDQVIDSISSAINADSISLDASGEVNDFNDAIPVIPNRRGVGKPEIESHIPDHNLRDMADLEYFMSKLNLLMRFPATYLDFTKELGQTAVSMIRSDLRYSKLCSSVRSKIETTLNDFIRDSKFNKYDPVYSLTKLPSSEDDDVIQALDNYLDIAIKAEEYLNSESETKEVKKHRLKALRDLFAASSNSPTLQKWYDDYSKTIDSGISGEVTETPGRSDFESGFEPTESEFESVESDNDNETTESDSDNEATESDTEEFDNIE